MTDTLCPCGSLINLAECCLAYVNGEKLPSTPESLMRSRYTAFCLSNADYLVKTLHPSKITPNTKSEILKTVNSTRWASLRVLRAEQKADEGKVEFVAFYSDKNVQPASSNICQLHELSHFVREEGKWLYVEGKTRSPIKLGRNDLCWCGSQKKLKKCHG